MDQKLRDFYENKKTEYVIAGLVILNAITLGLETSDRAMAFAGPLLIVADNVLLGIFTVELIGRMFAYRGAFFRDGWRIFDFVIVTIALLPSSGALSVLRALRILRILRLISLVPSLRRVVGAMITALPGMGSVMMLLGLVFYVASVIATKLYGDSFPQWFGSIGESAYSLFQIMTLESWSMGIVRPVMEEFPFAWMFFVVFILFSSFMVINLLIGIIVGAMQEEHEAALQEEEAGSDAAVRQRNDHKAVLAELKSVRTELAQLRNEIKAGAAPKT
ncbi:MAG: ion transporter [Alphaproteobacteria bacterium]|nr:ion transporter [Alphaproteobacteria bacterium]